MKFLPKQSRMLLVAGLLLAGQAFAAKPEAALFPEMSGWKKGEQKAWGPEDLYMPIDGAADLFLRYNFEEMQSIDYAVGDDTVSAEVYRHATEIDAYGIYSQGRPVREKYLELGVQAYAESDSLNLLAGRYYIEIRSSKGDEKSGEAMRALATKLAGQLNKGAKFPGFFANFPAEGKKPCTEKYLAKDVLGYAFLTQAYQVDYTAGGGDYSLLVCRAAGEKEARGMFEAYLKQVGRSGEAGVYLEIKDKYHGSVGLLLKGRNLLCLAGKFDPAKGAALLGSLASAVDKAAN